MEIQVELLDYFDRIEGEDITGYHAYVVDESKRRWKYAYHRQPRQSIDQFVQEVREAYRYNREEDFRMDSDLHNNSSLEFM